jgi:hypothetical protein
MRHLEKCIKTVIAVSGDMDKAIKLMETKAKKCRENA